MSTKNVTTRAGISYADCTGVAKFASIEKDGRVLLVLDHQGGQLQTAPYFDPDQRFLLPGLPGVSDWDYFGTIPVDAYIELDEARRGFLLIA